MLFYPRLKAGGRSAFDFALALTVGLLLFLLVDTLEEALELAAEAAPGFHGGTMVWLVAALTAALLCSRPGGARAAGSRGSGSPPPSRSASASTISAKGSRSARPSPPALPRSALSWCSASRSTTSPRASASWRPWSKTAPGCRSSSPSPRSPACRPSRVSGSGSYAFAPHWAALAFAVGAGAILQVIVEVGLLLARRSARPDGRGAATAASGVVAGVVVMYATALLVQL